MTTASPPPRHERTLRVLLRATIATTFVAAILVSLAPPAVASGILPSSNPRANIVPSPNFMAPGRCADLDGSWSCANPCISGKLALPVFDESQACTSYVLLALDAARRAEQVGPMILPSNWRELDPQEQLFVLADLERTARGLPPYLGLNARLSADAQHAAQRDADPGEAPGFAVGVDLQGYYGIGGAWASGFSPLVADYFWMYADGWGGSASRTYNLGCTSPSADACWAHRDELLGFDPRFNPGVGLWCRNCEMGTGFAITDGFASFDDLIELPANNPPAMTFTWAHNVVPYLARPTSHRSASSHARLRNVVRDAWAKWTPHVASRCSVNRTPQRRAGCRRDLHVARQIVGYASKEEQ